MASNWAIGRGYYVLRDASPSSDRKEEYIISRSTSHPPNRPTSRPLLKPIGLRRFTSGLLLCSALPALAAPAPHSGLDPTPVHRIERKSSLQWTLPVDRSGAGIGPWGRQNATQLHSVEAAWASLLERLRGHQPGHFERQCNALVGSLERVDETVLFPVPDRLIDLYLRRQFRHLHGAATACRAEQLFNVVYHLKEASDARAEVRWLLSRYIDQLSGQSTAAPPSH